MKPKSRSTPDENATRTAVRERYRGFASGTSSEATPPAGGSCCGGASTGTCCGTPSGAVQLGYSLADLGSLPIGANLGLGCGNPTAVAALRTGERVMDLGSGGGIDCFLAAKKVGPKGHVIGVDMTPEMVAKARDNARKGKYANVEFRLGEIEHLPAADGSVDVVISNCVINLAPDKAPVYREAFRVLRPGGRFAVSDVVATRPIPPSARADMALWGSCSSGALDAKSITALLRKAGFTQVQIDVHSQDAPADSLASQASLGVFPADIVATKPGA